PLPSDRPARTYGSVGIRRIDSNGRVARTLVGKDHTEYDLSRIADVCPLVRHAASRTHDCRFYRHLRGCAEHRTLSQASRRRTTWSSLSTFLPCAGVLCRARGLRCTG